MKAIQLSRFSGLLLVAGLFSLSSCHPDDPTPPGITDFCADINSATSWTNTRAGVDHRVTCLITVNSDMVIEEGTEIEFAEGAGIIVADAGSLKVNGTAANNVTMRGLTGATGEWNGLWFQSMDDNNELNY